EGNADGATVETPAVSSRLIGELFVKRKLITEEQLAQALKLQKDSGLLLGEIIVENFGVSRLSLASVLADQWAEVERPLAEAVTGDVDADADRMQPTSSDARLDGELRALSSRVEERAAQA